MARRTYTVEVDGIEQSVEADTFFVKEGFVTFVTRPNSTEEVAVAAFPANAVSSVVTAKQ
jgi:hypothetical protein